jgi:hypothetical protein
VHDTPTNPVFIRAAGDANDTVEFRLHFREFVRLQIGKSAEPGYRNWYRVSDYTLWRHVGKVKKNPVQWWIDDGSVAEKNNEGW